MIIVYLFFTNFIIVFTIMIIVNLFMHLSFICFRDVDIEYNQEQQVLQDVVLDQEGDELVTEELGTQELDETVPAAAAQELGDEQAAVSADDAILFDGIIINSSYSFDISNKCKGGFEDDTRRLVNGFLLKIYSANKYSFTF